MDYIVYTYEANATPLCHAYGPLSESDASALGGRLSKPGVTIMVLPLETPPAAV